MPPLSILGAGLPRTGTRSLCEALRVLGLRALHHAPDRLALRDAGTYRVYDDVDAVVDAPACHFWREILDAYPDCRVILTVRDEAAWWQSIERHVIRLHQGSNAAHRIYSDSLHTLLFGGALPNREPYLKAYRDHNTAVIHGVAAERRLVVDVTAGDAWEPLCGFLGVPRPCVDFPALNRWPYYHPDPGP